MLGITGHAIYNNIQGCIWTPTIHMLNKGKIKTYDEVFMRRQGVKQMVRVCSFCLIRSEFSNGGNFYIKKMEVLTYCFILPVANLCIL